MFVTHTESYVFGQSAEERALAEKIEKAWKDRGLEVKHKESTTQIVLSYSAIRKYES